MWLRCFLWHVAFSALGGSEKFGANRPHPQIILGQIYDDRTTSRSLAAPSNDECDGSTPLIVNGDVLQGTTTEATPDSPCSGTAETERGVWYIATGTGRIMTVSTCSANTDFATEVRVKTICPRSSCIDNEDPGSDVPCDSTFGATVTWDSVEDQTYYILVSGVALDDVGAFDISLVDYDPPINDGCGGAVPLTVNGPIVLGSTVQATRDSPCGGTGSTERGVWYLATGTGNIMTVSTCTPNADFATELRVKLTCPRSSCIDDEDPGFDVPCEFPFGSTVTFDSVEGETYYFLVSGPSVGDTGSFEIFVVDYDPPVNDGCDGVVPLTVNGPTVAGSTNNATRDSPCGSTGRTERGVWYLAPGTGKVMTVSTCSPGTSFATELRVKKTCPRSSCVDDEDPGFLIPCDEPFGATVTFDSEEGQTYYFLVSGSSVGDTGDFEIFVEDYEPPKNDVCAGVEALVINGPEILGSSMQATRDPPCGSTSRSERGVWYQAIGTGGELTVSTCSNATDFASEIYVKLTCPRSSCVTTASTGVVGCDNSFGAAATFQSDSGTIYYILVAGTTSATTGSFGIMATDLNAPPGSPSPTVTGTASTPTPSAAIANMTVEPSITPIPTANQTTSVPTKDPTVAPSASSDVPSSSPSSLPSEPITTSSPSPSSRCDVIVDHSTGDYECDLDGYCQGEIDRPRAFPRVFDECLSEGDVTSGSFSLTWHVQEICIMEGAAPNQNTFDADVFDSATDHCFATTWSWNFVPLRREDTYCTNYTRPFIGTFCQTLVWDRSECSNANYCGCIGGAVNGQTCTSCGGCGGLGGEMEFDCGNVHPSLAYQCGSLPDDVSFNDLLLQYLRGDVEMNGGGSSPTPATLSPTSNGSNPAICGLVCSCGVVLVFVFSALLF